MAQRDDGRDRAACEEASSEERKPPARPPTSSVCAALWLRRVLFLGRGRHISEGRILGQDRVLQATEVLSRLESEFSQELAPALLINLQRLSLAAAAIEGEHELRPQMLAQRVFRNEGLELCHHPGVLSQRQLGFDQFFARSEVELREPP